MVVKLQINGHVAEFWKEGWIMCRCLCSPGLGLSCGKVELPAGSGFLEV